MLARSFDFFHDLFRSNFHRRIIAITYERSPAAKRRRVEANFPGAQRILSQIKTGPTEKRVGLLLGQGPPARQGAPVLTPEGERVGKVTSGGPSPTLGRPIAMGYIPSDLAQFGGGVLIEVRGKTYKATVTKMPFVKTNYYISK